MDFVIFIVTICIIYFVLWFFDSFFKSCMFYPYDALLRGTGLTIRFLYIQWHTTAINRSFIKWANHYPKLFTLSFNIGIYVALILMPISFILHLLSLITSLSSSSMQSTTAVAGIPSSASIIIDDSSSSSSSATSSIFNNIELEIMLPGINLPLNEIIYYILALGICSITHEIGHAIAAILEDVAVTGVGIKIFFILPIAYTELNIDSLNSLKFWKKLRILCAGIWHNIVLSILCYLIFSMSTTILLKPFYQINNAVIITQIHPNSPLLDKNYNNNNNDNGNGIGPSTGDNNLNINRGLKIGDVITEINSCRIKNIDSWYDCLLETIKIQPNYCIQSDFILNNDESVHDGGGGGGVGGADNNNNFLTECCDKKNIKNLCYEYVPDSYYSMSELPQFMCLNIRLVIENSLNYCHHKDERNLCKKENSYCIKPVINNSTTIIHIRRHDIFDKISPTITAAGVATPTDKTIDQQHQQQQQNKLIKQDVIYIGHPYDLSNTIKISEYIPKTNFLPANVADSFILLLKYCIVFSLGLAVVNILPIFNFDGQHIMQTILNHYLQPIVPERKKREQFSIIIISIGTIFLIISILKILWISMLRNLL